VTARAAALVLFVVLGFAFLSRSCAFTHAGGPIALMHGRVVNATGLEQTTRFLAIAGGKIESVSFYADHAAPVSGAREIDVNGLYVAAATFDRSVPAYIDGIRHVWVGQLNVGDPGDVVIMRSNPARVRAGFIPDNSDIAGAVIDGVYYTARDLARRHPVR
jgi:imidazolonepropionase-like amidohydrolase